MKTKEELNALKEEVETLNKKLCELTDEELEQVSGGVVPLDFYLKHDFVVPADDFARLTIKCVSVPLK